MNQCFEVSILLSRIRVEDNPRERAPFPEGAHHGVTSTKPGFAVRGVRMSQNSSVLSNSRMHLQVLRKPYIWFTLGMSPPGRGVISFGGLATRKQPSEVFKLVTGNSNEPLVCKYCHVLV